MSANLLIITALESELKREYLPVGVEIIYCGVGKINSALASARAIDQFSPRQILNFGSVGKINPSLEGLLSIGKVIQRDMNAEPLAPRGETPFCARPQEYLSGGQFICGSGDSFVTAYDPWLKDQGIDVVDMELFAIAAVAHDHGIPWASFKYITDDANENSGNDWREKVHFGQNLFLQELKQLLS